MCGLQKNPVTNCSSPSAHSPDQKTHHVDVAVLYCCLRLLLAHNSLNSYNDNNNNNNHRKNDYSILCVSTSQREHILNSELTRDF